MTSLTNCVDAISVRKAITPEGRRIRVDAESTLPGKSPGPASAVPRKRPKLIVAGIPRSAGVLTISGGFPSTLGEPVEELCELADDGTPLNNIVVDEKKKKKKTLQKKKKLHKEQKSGISVKSCSDYLNTWKTDRENWKFIKVRQTWLLQHMYDDDKVSDLDFQVLTNYLEALKGQARKTTVQHAESVLSTADVSSEEEAGKDGEEGVESKSIKSRISEKQQTRAKDILQLLS